MSTIKRPVAGEFAPYYEAYINLVPEGSDICDILLTQHMETIELLTSLDDETLNSTYAPGKWTILDILAHVMDSERIFTYRALRIARGDQTPLAGYDHDAYVAEARFTGRKILDMVREFSVLRSSTIEFFKGLPEQMTTRTGTANNNKVSVRAIAYIIAGHEMHHRTIIENRYIGKFNA